MVFVIVARAERKIDWMARMAKQPARPVALGNRCGAVADVLAPQYEQRRAWIEVEFGPALETRKIQPGLMTGTWRQRIIEIVADP